MPREPGKVDSFQQFRSNLSKYEHETVDLDGTLDELVRVLAKAVQSLKAEMVRDTGIQPENRVVSVDFSRRLKEVTAALSAATTCQNALYKTAKQRAAQMTPEERKAALTRITLSLDYHARRKLVLELVEKHNEKYREAVALGLEDPNANHRNPLGIQVEDGGPTKIFVEVA